MMYQSGFVCIKVDNSQLSRSALSHLVRILDISDTCKSHQIYDVFSVILL